MKASELKPGDRIGPWTVVRTFEVCGVVERVSEYVSADMAGNPVVTKSAERSADPWNTLVHVEMEKGIDPGTWRTWYRADEEVTP